MPNRPARTPSELDLGVAERQAIGGSYTRPIDQERQLERINAGTIRIRPHGDWTGDYTAWSSDPFMDRNWQFQFHSLRWMTPLRWAALDGDVSSRAEWLRIARSWFEAHVPFRTGLAPFAWKDMTDGNRAIHLSLGAPLVGPDDDWYVDLLSYHRDWLMDPGHIKKKNHGLHQHAGLLVVGATLRDQHAMDTAVARMEAQFATTFDEQGCNDEGSVGYQQHNLKWWRTAWYRASLEGYQSNGVQRRLAEGAHALAHMTMPDGQIPQIGDSARGTVSRRLHAYTDFAASRGSEGDQPRGTALVLDGGYVLSRSGWGETRAPEQESHMVLRHGQDMRSHSHQDRGSLHIYAAGTRWLTDSGFYSYQPGDPIRRHLASRKAHNIALLPGLEHDSTALVELVASSITDDAHDFTVVDRGYTDAETTRRVVYLPGADCWIVIDSATSALESPLTQLWHVEPGVESRFRDRGFQLRHGQAKLNMTWLGQAPRLRRHIAADGDMRGWVGTKWKTLTPGELLVATASASTASRLVTLISPNTPQALGVVESLVQRNGTVSATLVRAGRSWRIVVGAAGVSVVEE